MAGLVPTAWQLVPRAGKIAARFMFVLAEPRFYQEKGILCARKEASRKQQVLRPNVGRSASAATFPFRLAGGHCKTHLCQENGTCKPEKEASRKH